MNKRNSTLLLGLAAALFLFFLFAAPSGVLSAAVSTSTRWPTVTRRPTDTRWPVKPTNTRWPTAARTRAGPTPSPRPTETRVGVRPANTRWPTVTLRPIDTRWATKTATGTKTPRISLTPSFTPTASNTPTISNTPTETGTPTETPTPTQTFTETATLDPSLAPTITSTPLPLYEGPIVIGTSVLGRPLEVYRFGTGPTERLIVAGMHGGSEYNTIQLADLLIAQIKAHPELIPSDVTLYILRALNPDGAARAMGPNGRANANGVDLNRNWDANWQADWPRAGCWTTPPVTGGTGPGSEPETQALMAFILSHRFDGLINYHSAALGIFNGGLPDFPPSNRLAEAVAAVTNYPYPPINTGCKYTGGMVDWTSAQGIASLDVELTDHTHTDYYMNLKVLNVLVTWKP